MTKREVAILACRVLAIYAAIISASWVPTIVHEIAQTREWNLYAWIALVIELIGPAALLVLALYLWHRAGVIGAWIFGHELQDDQDEPESVVVHASLSDVHVVVLSSIGLWFVVDSVARGLGFVAQIILTAFLSAGSWDGWSIWTGATLAELLVRFLLGMWLIFGSRTIVQWLRRVKNIGVKPPEEDNSTFDSANSEDRQEASE